MKHLKTAWRHMRRSPYQALAAIFIMIQTIVVITLFSFLVIISSRLINYFESLPQLDVFFKNDTKQADIDSLMTQLKASGHVSDLKFVSQDEALKIYQDKFKSDPILLEFVTADTLPPSLQISTTNVGDLNVLSSQMQKDPIVDKVYLPQQVVSKLTMWTGALRKVGIALIAILSLDSIFIMIIIIGIKISQRKEEMQIMRLLGATLGYVRMPFILEGIIYGIIGAIIGWAIATGILFYATPILNYYFEGIEGNILPLSFSLLLEVLGIEVVIALILGTLSSFLAVFRQVR